MGSEVICTEVMNGSSRMNESLACATFSMLAVAVAALPRVALTGAESVTVKFSSPSSTSSRHAVTKNSCSVLPGGKVSVPRRSSKSFALAVSPLSTEVAKSTVTVLSEAEPVRMTLTLNAPPSAAVYNRAPSDNTGRPPTSRIVPVAVASASVACVGVESITVKVSSYSSRSSAIVSTDMRCSVSPGLNVTVPGASPATKSEPAIAPFSPVPIA